MERKEKTTKSPRYRGVLCLILGIWLVVSCILTMPLQTQAAGSPGLNAAVNKKNIMKVLNKYDTDGAFILKNTESINDYMVWFSKNARIVDGIDTAVHEQCHAYTHSGWNQERIYIGSKKSIDVPFTKVFRSKKMAKSIPQRCRTFRYSTYIGQPIANLSSDVQGIYGILNEFNAYCWGMNNTICLYDYYDQFKPDLDTWGQFVINGANGRVAYCEFKYYTLHYLYYAKTHDPEVYQGIMNNKKYKTAYKKTEKRFAALVKAYEKDLKRIKAKAAKAGYDVQLSEDTIRINRSSYGLLYADYHVLKKELNKKIYKDIHYKLIN